MVSNMYKLMKKTGSIVLVGLALGSMDVNAAGNAPKPPKQEWSFNGMFGTFDRAAGNPIRHGGGNPFRREPSHPAAPLHDGGSSSRALLARHRFLSASGSS